MLHSRPSILSRLRTRRGLWLVGFATLLFKLVAGTVCMADGLTSPQAPLAPVAVAAAMVDTDSGSCVLGEAGGCHCACAHAAPVRPTTHATERIAHVAGHEWPLIASCYLPPHAGSLLRPPIA
jgi:hypothetical protein